MPQSAELERELASAVDGEVRFDAGTRGAYSTDGSNFRQVPIGVVLPRSVEAAVAAVGVCRRHGVPLLSRGGGTSLAGQCANTAVVIDWSKYCHRVLDIDAEQKTATVEPGIVLDVLNEHLKPHRLRFGPEPATHMNCTIGGMIGNNSCGATAQRTGKVVDNIEALEVLLHPDPRARQWRPGGDAFGRTARDRGQPELRQAGNGSRAAPGTAVGAREGRGTRPRRHGCHGRGRRPRCRPRVRGQGAR